MTTKKKKSSPIFSLRLKTQGVPSGHVPVPNLVTICEETQKVVTRQAEALEGRKTQHPGPTKASIRRDCTLELIGLKKGSTTLQFGLAKPQVDLPFEDYGHFGAEVIRELATTIKALSNGRRQLDKVFDEGILQSLYRLGSVVEGEKPTTLEWIAPKRGPQKRISAKLEKSTREKIALHLSQPKKAVVQVNGILDMADFKPGDKRCRIDPPIGASIVCTFEDQYEDRVYSLLRKAVSVTGIAVLEPHTGRIETLTIDKIEPLPSLSLGEGGFFASPSLTDLAELQKVAPIRDSSILAGGIPDSEDLDEFLREIYESRK